MPELIDIGANLAHDSFDRDRAAVIERAFAAGVSRIIVTGSSVASTAGAIDLAHEYPGSLFATAGLHPHHASDYDDTVRARLHELATQPPVVAAGECGLDYYRNFSPPADQRAAFEGQLEIAAETGKPVFLHQRDAHDDFVALLEKYLPQIPGGVAHCFTGSREELREYLDMGLYIGITGWICDERRGHALRDAVGALPLDRVMLETDAPYLLPRDLESKPDPRRNEPAVLPHILQAAAKHMGHAAAEVAAAATANAERLFGLPQDVKQR